MAPRKYQLGKRAAAAEATRQRIVEAIVALHAEHGVAATTVLDVARRADVAVGTVLRYFPTLDAMVRACGPVVHAHARPPGATIFNDVTSPQERVRTLCREQFAFYARGAPWFARSGADAAKIPALAESIAHLEARHRALVDAALAPFAPDDDTRRVAIALTAFPTWQAMRAAGLDTPRAADAAAELLFLHLTARKVSS